MKTFGRRSNETVSSDGSDDFITPPPVPVTNFGPSFGELRKRPVPTSLENVLSQLRGRVLEMVEPSAAAELPAEELRRQLEVLVHEVAHRYGLEHGPRLH